MGILGRFISTLSFLYLFFFCRPLLVGGFFIFIIIYDIFQENTNYLCIKSSYFQKVHSTAVGFLSQACYTLLYIKVRENNGSKVSYY